MRTLIGPYLVLVLRGCGRLEVVRRETLLGAGVIGAIFALAGAPRS